MQHILDFFFLCLIFKRYIIRSGLPYRSSQAFKASDILCLLTNPGSIPLANQLVVHAVVDFHLESDTVKTQIESEL